LRKKYLKPKIRLAKISGLPVLEKLNFQPCEIDDSPSKAILSFCVEGIALQRHKSGGGIVWKETLAFYKIAFYIKTVCKGLSYP
jgi:hypothetical protein